MIIVMDTCKPSFTIDSVLVTGGAGYIGSALVPSLLAGGYHVSILDRFFFGRAPLDAFVSHPKLRLYEGDIRDVDLVRSVYREGRFDAVIHLAAISNDPSSELDPQLTESINLVGLRHVMELAREFRVKRFLYASSASVYGLKKEPDVTEDLSLEPLTLYAELKSEGENVLNGLIDDDFVGVSVRSATVCGWSPRLRLDLTINILTEHAVRRRCINVFGGSQMRPNVCIDDLCRFYLQLLRSDSHLINGEAFNVSAKNASVRELADMVRACVGNDVTIDTVATDDKRSYRLSTQKAQERLNFSTELPLEQAVDSIVTAFADGRVIDPDSPLHRNVEQMKVFLAQQENSHP